jgi:short-subunit dehydrogenase
MLTAYSTTKHTLIGLSTSLRAEAVKYGVKISVVCPGAIRTDEFEKAHCVKLNREKALSALLSLPMMDTVTCAHVILRGVIRNKRIITVTLTARLVWWLYRLSQTLEIFLTSKVLSKLWAEFCESLLCYEKTQHL